MARPSASSALETLTVLDLTRVRAGPTCVRQLADWGAKVIKIEMPEEGDSATQTDFSARHDAGFPESASQQARHDAQPQERRRYRRAPAHGRARRRGGRELSARREAPARHRLCGAQRGQPAADLRQHFRLRPGRTLPRPSRRRSDRAGHVRSDVGHRRAGARPDAGRHRAGRSLRRHLRRHRHPGGAVRARTLRPRPMGADLAAAGADFHARLPGRALPDVGRSARAGRQQPSDRRADRRLQDPGRLCQCRADAGDVAALLQGYRARGSDRARRLRHTQGSPPQSRLRSTMSLAKSPRP